MACSPEDCWVGSVKGVGTGNLGVQIIRNLSTPVSGDPAGILHFCLCTMGCLSLLEAGQTVRTASCGNNADTLSFHYIEWQLGSGWSYLELSVMCREARAV